MTWHTSRVWGPIFYREGIIIKLVLRCSESDVELRNITCLFFSVLSSLKQLATLFVCHNKLWSVNYFLSAVCWIWFKHFQMSLRPFDFFIIKYTIMFSSWLFETQITSGYIWTNSNQAIHGMNCYLLIQLFFKTCSVSHQTIMQVFGFIWATVCESIVPLKVYIKNCP